jgi:hypothetical protein
MSRDVLFAPRARRIGGLALCLVICATAGAQTSKAKVSEPVVPAAPAVAASAPRIGIAGRQQRESTKAKKYYVASWGVDKMRVSTTASGNLVRFSYRVSDPERAKVLGDKKFTPYMINPRTRAVLQVPVMDKVGMLRQATAPQAGQEYWMVFSNKGNVVRQGDRVNVVIGAFHADGLMVE